MKITSAFKTDDGERLLRERPLVAATAKIRDCEMGAFTEVLDYVEMAESTLGDYSYVCRFSSVIYTDIGKFSNIADMTRINPGTHPIERPSLHHFTYRGQRYGFKEAEEESFFNWRRRQRVVIGHDTWIGHGAIIMPGVRIGNGAVVGSLSVVTRDVPPYAVVAGSPSKIIRKRFPRSIADALQKIRWWDWTHEMIEKRFEDFKDLRVFLDKYAVSVNCFSTLETEDKKAELDPAQEAGRAI